MRIARKKVGYLINFGKNEELEWKRFVVEDLHVRTMGSSREHSCTLIEHESTYAR